MSWLDWIGDLFGGLSGSTAGEAASGVSDVASAAGSGMGSLGDIGQAASGFGSASDVASGMGGSGIADIASGVGQGAKDAAGGSFFPSMNAAGDKMWGGVKEGWKDIGGLKGVATAAGIGATGLGAYSSMEAAKRANEQAKLQRHAQGLQEQAAVPLTNFGQDALRRAQSGQIPQAVEQQIQVWKSGALQQARDLFARMGIPVGTSETSAEQFIEQQAQAMRAKYLETETNQGITALGQGSQIAGQMQQGAEREGASIDALIQQANAMLAKLGASTN